jgi:hypothetical protein
MKYEIDGREYEYNRVHEELLITVLELLDQKAAEGSDVAQEIQQRAYEQVFGRTVQK